jgi:hypothetical protein
MSEEYEGKENSVPLAKKRPGKPNCNISLSLAFWKFCISDTFLAWWNLLMYCETLWKHYVFRHCLFIRNYSILWICCRLDFASFRLVLCDLWNRGQFPTTFFTNTCKVVSYNSLIYSLRRPLMQLILHEQETLHKKIPFLLRLLDPSADIQAFQIIIAHFNT